MNALDVPLSSSIEAAQKLSQAFAKLAMQDFMRIVIENLFKGEIALVSSFGADSAVLLHMVSKIDPSFPVIFIDTGMLFQETLDYHEKLVSHLGLTGVKRVKPEARVLGDEDPENFLWASNPDRCCALRKVLPLAAALEGYAAWITGRKRFQAATRSELAYFEVESGKVKFNPLAGWTQANIDTYFELHGLPKHPLVAQGYPSIGCIPCTSKVRPGEDPRAGRWRGKAKLECGIHAKPPEHEALLAETEL